MRGVNKVILVGTLGKDPETKTFPNGGSLTQFSIATSESWVDKNTGERKEQTEWHRIVLHNRLGEIAQQYLRKGSKVYIEGSLRTRQWTDQNGQERYSTEIRGDQMQMLDSRQQGEQGVAMTSTSQDLTTITIRVAFTGIRALTITRMVMVKAVALLVETRATMQVAHRRAMALIHQKQHHNLRRLPLRI